MHQSTGCGKQASLNLHRDVVPCPPLGTINVIFAVPNREVGPSFEVMTILLQPGAREEVKESKRIWTKEEPILGFSEVEKVGTFQPHYDAFVVNL